MELAERLGMTEARLRSEMSGRELHRWQVLDRVRLREREKAERDAKRKRGRR